MTTPIKTRKVIINKFGSICMVRANPDPYDSPVNDGTVDGSPISVPRKKAKVRHDSPIAIVINDPNMTPLAVNGATQP